MCPCTVATEVRRCFKILVLSPGHVLKSFFFMDFSNIDRTGKKDAAWRYFASSIYIFSCLGLLEGKDCLYVYLSFGIVLHPIGASDVVYCPKYWDL